MTKKNLFQFLFCFSSCLAGAHFNYFSYQSFWVVFGLIILLVSLLAAIFVKDKIFLGWVLTGALAGVTVAENFSSLNLGYLDFIVWVSLLSILVALLFWIFSFVAQKYDAPYLHGNGSILGVIAFLGSLVFWVLVTIFKGVDWSLINPDGMFAQTEQWHFLFVPLAIISTYITSHINKQVDSVYNQYSIMMISALILVGAIIITEWLPYSSEMVTAWVAGILVGMTRLPDFNSLKPYITAATVFGILYILFRNVLPDFRLFFTVLVFVSIFTIQFVIAKNTK